MLLYIDVTIIVALTVLLLNHVVLCLYLLQGNRSEKYIVNKASSSTSNLPNISRIDQPSKLMYCNAAFNCTSIYIFSN